jgi:uncharacterized phage protein (TIGR01671 family)
MKKEVLFRGISVDSGQYVYGFYVYNKYLGKHYILEPGFDKDYFKDVVPDSVAQWTGLEDKNGIQIFDGDKMKIIIPTDVFWGKNSGMEKIGIVRYEPDYGGYIIEWEWSKNQHHERLTCDIAFEGEVLK